MQNLFTDWQQNLVGRLQECVRLVGGKKQLALKGGMSLAQLYRYLSGVQTPQVWRLYEIAKASSVSPHWLMLGEVAREVTPEMCGLQTLHETYSVFEQAYLEYGGKFNVSQKADLLTLLALAVELEKQQGKTSDLLHRGVMIEAFYFLQPLLEGNRIHAYLKGIQQAHRQAMPPAAAQRFAAMVAEANRYLFNSKVGELYYARMGTALPPHRLHLLHQLQQQVVHAVGIYRQLHVLDLGCGNGRHLLHWAKSTPTPETLVGVDGSALAIREAARHGQGKPIKWVHADVCQTGLPDARFTFINCMSVLNYLPYLPETDTGAEALMAEAYRLLQPGGVMHISARAGEAVEYVPFERAYTHSQLLSLAQRQGFKVLHLRQEDLINTAESCIPAKYRSINFMLLQK